MDKAAEQETFNVLRHHTCENRLRGRFKIHVGTQGNGNAEYFGLERENPFAHGYKAAITQEITEIVAGANAMAED
ncbi:hypothetical protein AGMMS49975_11050 [Clostridia bacterium]|nr:hypothetical protein AGMMS49975_11050 [Clostridia bacterium]